MTNIIAIITAFKAIIIITSNAMVITIIITTTITAMYPPHGMAMAEVEGRYDLPEEPPSFLRWQTTFLHQVVKQLATTHVLQHQVADKYSWTIVGLIIAADQKCEFIKKRARVNFCHLLDYFISRHIDILFELQGLHGLKKT